MVIPKPLLHPRTQAALERTIKNPPHALLVVGPAGIGKAAVTEWLSAEILTLPVNKLNASPHYVSIASPDGKAIGIEVVRELEHNMSLKSTGRRVVAIHDAHLLTTEAQNALLKTLEEPPIDTVLLLSSTQAQALLPTIRSRLQTIDIVKPSEEAVRDLLKESGANERDIAQAMALSGGLPGLALALINNDTDHPLVQAAQTARQLLQQSAFDKLTQVDMLAKDKGQGRNVVYILSQMAHAALLTGRSSDRWQRILRASYETDKALAENTQPKLALTNLMLNL